MDGIQILLIAAAAAGVVLVAVSFFIQANKKTTDDDEAETETASAITAIGASVEEADNAAEELHKLAGSVMEELENKYQELLFLYNLIDEKKKETYNNYKNNDSGAKRGERKKTLKHPRQQEIQALVDEGVKIPEIAKRLGMGQGEVSLILELGNR